MKVLLGFSFGHRGPEPGTSNEAIAKVIHRLAPERIIVQWEIGTALQRLGMVADQEIFTHRDPDRYLGTREVARQMAEKLERTRTIGEEIGVIAHPAHLPRCVRALARCGVRADPFVAEIPYDPRSHQVWTRSPILFRLHELIASPLSFLARQTARTLF
jgi:hypothetical protein